MTAPQGLCYFSGIQSLLSAQFTLQHGISPSVATIRIPPQQGRLLEGGEMVWSYGGVRVRFPGCKVDRISAEISQDGREIWALTVLDRRWKWKETGKISGFYNTRRGEKIVAGTERTPRDLATLCLQAMGEKRFSVQGMPNALRPEIEWDYANPAQALGALCDQLGCRVILKLDDSVSIEKVGTGNRLPAGGDVLSNSLALDPPERPDALVFVAGRTRYQVDFDLEPVALDLDLRIKPIKDLKFAPAPGWAVAYDESLLNVTDQRAREWYLKSVFRWYRIKTPFRLPGIGKPIKSLQHILPIEDKQITREKGGENKPLPAWVFGKWDAGFETDQAYEDTPFQQAILARPAALYERGFTLDVQRGIVKFNEPMRLLYDFAKDPSKRRSLPAILRLRTTISLRDPKTGAWMRHEIRRDKRGKKFGTLPRYITRDDIALHFQVNPFAKKFTSNLKAVEAQARHYLDVAEREYQLSDPRSITYAGIKPINPDGAIQQVTFAISEQGFATTSASRNREQLHVAMSYKERRFIEKLHYSLAERDVTERTKKEKAKKAEA